MNKNHHSPAHFPDQEKWAGYSGATEEALFSRQAIRFFLGFSSVSLIAKYEISFLIILIIFSVKN